MNEIKPGDPHTEIQHEHGHDRSRYPYWKRAHQDWKFWVAIVLMLAAMAVYLKSNDLSHPSPNQVQQPTP